MTIPILSLFSGCGGFDLGFERAGFRVIAAFDSDPVAVTSYNANRQVPVAKHLDLAKVTDKALLTEIRKLSPLMPSGVIGGPPCQPFSNGNNTRHIEDEIRKNLPTRYAGILKLLSSVTCLDFFVFENVRGITHQKHKEAFSEFKAKFEAAGFDLFEELLDAQYFGVPQVRPRVFVVGFRKSLSIRDFRFPSPRRIRRTVFEAIGALPPPRLFERGLTPKDIPHHQNHWAMFPKSEKFQSGFLKEGQNKGKSFKVLAWNKPSCTVAYGNREVHVHPSGSRRLSVYEAMLLQGFPRSYRIAGTLSDQIRQVSDAVPPPLAQALATSVKKCLEARRLESDDLLGSSLASGG